MSHNCSTQRCSPCCCCCCCRRPGTACMVPHLRRALSAGQPPVRRAAGRGRTAPPSAGCLGPRGWQLQGRGLPPTAAASSCPRAPATAAPPPRRPCACGTRALRIINSIELQKERPTSMPAAEVWRQPRRWVPGSIAGATASQPASQPTCMPTDPLDVGGIGLCIADALKGSLRGVHHPLQQQRRWQEQGQVLRGETAGSSCGSLPMGCLCLALAAGAGSTCRALAAGAGSTCEAQAAGAGCDMWPGCQGGHATAGLPCLLVGGAVDALPHCIQHLLEGVGGGARRACRHRGVGGLCSTCHAARGHTTMQPNGQPASRAASQPASQRAEQTVSQPLPRPLPSYPTGRQKSLALNQTSSPAHQSYGQPLPGGSGSPAQSHGSRNEPAAPRSRGLRAGGGTGGSSNRGGRARQRRRQRRHQQQQQCLPPMPLPITTTSVSDSMVLAAAAAGGGSRVAEQLVCREALRLLLTALTVTAHWLILIVSAHGPTSRLLAPVWVAADCSWAEPATLIPPTSCLDRGGVGQSADTAISKDAATGEEA